MTRFSAKTAMFLAASALCTSALVASCSKGTSSSNSDVGDMKLALTLPGGVVINTVSYTVKTAASATIATGSIDVSQSPTISVDLVLPPGVGDTITLTATSTLGVVYTGTSAPFNVVSGQTSLVTVSLTTGSVVGTNPGQVNVNGTITAGNNSPSITSGSVSPASVFAGSPVAVSVVASDPDAGDTLTYLWTATAGTFSNATAASSSYTSNVVGTQTLTILVSDNHGASTSVTFSVNIIASGAGGSVGTGGVVATGGTAAGGAVGTGGVAAGGAVGTGGVAAGGTVGTGGVAAGGKGGTAAGGSVGTGGVVATGGTVGTGGTNVAAACAMCQLGSSNGNCDPGFITASGDGTGPFGCAGLPTQAMRDTCAALLTCMNSNSCSTNSTGTAAGDNPVEGCYCGPSPNTSSACLSGTATGICLAQFHAAATASAGGPAAGSAEGMFSSFIATAAFDPSTAVGMAANVKTCAIDAPCAVCNGL